MRDICLNVFSCGLAVSCAICRLSRSKRAAKRLDHHARDRQDQNCNNNGSVEIKYSGLQIAFVQIALTIPTGISGNTNTEVIQLVHLAQGLWVNGQFFHFLMSRL